MFCKQYKELVIFPSRMSYREATRMCHIHGGQVLVPESQHENRNALDILARHNITCMNKAALSMGQGLWLGYAHMEKDPADVTTNTGTTFTKYSKGTNDKFND